MMRMMRMMRMIELNSFRLKQDKNTVKPSIMAGKEVNEVYKSKVQCHKPHHHKLNDLGNKLHYNEVYDNDHVHDVDDYDNDVNT